jgi:bifunctional ADP-heptose synthase (sugar kinase/adenylyltransferase)
MSLSVLNRLRDDPHFFKGKKILAVGDIALDRSFLCREAPRGVHATHAGETNYDIETRGDDYGRVGATNNVCLFCISCECDTALLTAIGSDNEGARVKELLTQHGVTSKCLKLDGIDTVTRLRFFVFNENERAYELKYRMNKEPHLEPAVRRCEQLIDRTDIRKWILKELATSDALIVNDFEKGFLSRPVIQSLAKMLAKANKKRAEAGLPNVITIVDPKNNWEKFIGFPVTFLKPNHKEACHAVGIEDMDLSVLANQKRLAENVFRKFGEYFQGIIITLGGDGALFVEAKAAGAEIYLFPAIPPKSSQFVVATHCGDIFDVALALALVKKESVPDAITFGNCAGSLQVSKRTGDLTSLPDFVDQINYNHMLRHYVSHNRIDVIEDNKEQIAIDILKSLGGVIDYRKGLYSRNGRTGTLVAGPPYARSLDKLAGAIRPGRMLLIHGESGTGKGAIIDNMGIFVDGFDLQRDSYNAHDVLDRTGQLEKAIQSARLRRTCIVLDEIQKAGDGAITKLLTRFSKQDFGEPFCLICAGHLDKKRQTLLDLSYRAECFEVPPFRRDERRYDLPFLIGQVLRSQTSPYNNIRRVNALALRELLRFDYDTNSAKNWRALQKVLEASCRSVRGDTLDWDNINLAIVEGHKSQSRPSLSQWISFLAVEG